MKSFYFTDTISLTNFTQDETYGNKTESTRTVECRVEPLNKLITNSQGQDIRTHTLIMMDTAEVINTGDSYKILTIRGKASREATKSYQVKVVFDNGGLGDGNLEVYS